MTKNLVNDIADALKEYTKDVEDGLKKEQMKAARKAAKILRSTSPINVRGKRSGRYRSGWTSKKVDKGYTVHNRTDGQLTHLLEKGHVLRQGGYSPAIPHIAPVEQTAIDEYTKGVERVIKG